ncbi:hypothetical protein [Candidatus Marithrix sp. Canyon 246]|uniref:hypothetical protein n=1 Tax=Candidatus Marithrix sp. Canyon 246 TaxID=1827136 RepID=UPI00149618C0|nr:hypothetical protein [Candidatus Marithrix sp. Canyon 246]
MLSIASYDKIDNYYHYCLFVMLSVENLSIAHKNHQVLDDFNLGLESGEMPRRIART